MPTPHSQKTKGGRGRRDKKESYGCAGAGGGGGPVAQSASLTEKILLYRGGMDLNSPVGNVVTVVGIKWGELARHQGSRKIPQWANVRGALNMV